MGTLVWDLIQERGEKFSSLEEIHKIEEVENYLLELFGERREVIKWLREPNEALNWATPYRLMMVGRTDDILRIFDQMDDGCLS